MSNTRDYVYQIVSDVDADELKEVPVTSPAPPMYAELVHASHPSAMPLPSYDDATSSSKEKEHNESSSCESHPVVVAYVRDEAALLGNDMQFFASFLLSFFFNIIGLIVCLIASATKAGKYGAVSGYGAAIIKVTIIADHMYGISIWSYVALVILGALCCLDGLYLYAKAKRDYSASVRAGGNVVRCVQIA